MTTATKITLFRVVMIPVFLVCMYLSEIWSWMQIVSCVVFAVASLSDILDGQIARRCNQVTDLGKFLDPLADKVLVIAAMAMFCEWGIYPAWALMIVLAREFAVTGLRLIAAGKGRVIAAGWSGKVKTAVTMTGLSFMLVFGRRFVCSTGSSWPLSPSRRSIPASNTSSGITTCSRIRNNRFRRNSSRCSIKPRRELFTSSADKQSPGAMHRGSCCSE